MSDQFLFHQALFGYREGHNLVASSVALAPRVRQFLANVTDGSGPEKSEGFGTAFTGLPVPETHYYALFCTWPAPEMSRPGCVWSHVLLVDLADLARIPDLSVLRGLFLQPAVPPLFSDFEQPLPLLISDEAHGLPRMDDESRAILLLTALYGQPESGLVILDKKGEPWEAIVFALWSQQWPRLRRNFAFSTGSFGDRRSSGIAFDLQVAPVGSQRLWGRGKAPTTVHEFSFKASPAPPPPWARTALDDLYCGSAGPLRKFLFTYGSEVEDPRAAFSKLVQCFVEPSEGEDPGERLLHLASTFPQPSDALGLKRNRLAALVEQETSLDLGAAWIATCFLLQTQESAAFDRVPIDFALQMGNFWQQKNADILALLGNLPENERTNAFLLAFASVLAPKDIPTLWHEQPAVLQRLVAIQPGLAADPAAWTIPETGQRALWNSLREATTDQRFWALTCGAMLQAQCSVAERKTVDLAGASLADGLLLWLKADGLRLPSPLWRDAIRAPLAAALQNEILEPPLLALAAWALPPEEARSIAGDRADVQSLALHSLAGVPDPLVLPTLFWLTALGFQTTSNDSFVLLRCAFFHVYDAVASSRYPGEAWEILAPVLPDLFFGEGWDRCRRLRRALRKWLRNHPKFVKGMTEAAPTREHARLVQKLC